MRKVFNLKSEEDVTVVVERLWETGAEEIFLLAPPDSVLLQNIIALRLLKREADRLGKEIIVVTKNEVAREMLKRAGLTVKVSLPKSVVDESSSKEISDGRVFHDLPAGEFEALLKEQVRLKRQAAPRSLNDIQPKTELSPASRKIIIPGVVDKNEASKMNDESLDDFLSRYEVPETVEDENKSEEAAAVSDETGLTSGEPAKFKSASLISIEQNEPSLEKEEEFPVRMMSKEQKEEVPEEREEKKIILEKFSSGLRGMPLVEKKESSVKRSVSSLSLKFIGAFAITAVLLAGAALYLILPKVDISITPKAEAFSQDLNVVADKSINKTDAAAGKIPAQLLRLDKKISKEYLATGQRQLNEKAQGTITIYNEYSSSPQALVEKTRFVSVDGKTFRLVKTIVVPGAQIQEGKIVANFIDAQIVADQPGQDYNIGSSRFTIPGFVGSPKYTAFYGQSKSAMTGGASGIFKVVSQEDFDKAKADIWQNLQPALDQEFKAQIPSGLKSFSDTLKEEMSEVSSSIEVDGRAENFTLAAKGTATVLLFDEADLVDLLKVKITDRLGSDKEILTNQLAIDYQDVKPDFSKGQISFRTVVRGKIISKIDLAGLKNSMAGKNEAEVKAYFGQHPEITKARVTFWPFWVKSVPTNSDKIKISQELDGN
jgi:hypothetical protein